MTARFSEAKTGGHRPPLQLPPLLFRFAFDADTSPGNGFEACRGDVIFAFHTSAVRTLIDTVDGFFDSPEEFGVGLFQCKTYVEVIFLARLVNPIAALRTRF